MHEPAVFPLHGGLLREVIIKKYFNTYILEEGRRSVRILR